jgi:hypothetical protein
VSSLMKSLICSRFWSPSSGRSIGSASSEGHLKLGYNMTETQKRKQSCATGTKYIHLVCSTLEN